MKRSFPPAIPIVALALAVLAGACGNQVPKYEDDAFSSDPVQPGPFYGKLVVTNFGDDSLSVLDPDTRTQLWKVPIGFVPVEGEGPHHLSGDPRGEFLYVNLSEAVPGSGSGPHGAHGTGTIPGIELKIDTRDGRLVQYVQIDRNPGDNLLSADGKTLYVTHYDLLAWLSAINAGTPRKGDSRLAIIDTEKMAIKRFVELCPAAHGLSLSADGNTLFASCMTDEIAVLDVSRSDSEVRRVPLSDATEKASCSGCPYALGTAPDGRVWAGLLGPGNNSKNGFVGLYDTQKNSFDLESSLRFCGGAFFPAFSKADAAGGYSVYVPEQGPCGDAVRIFQVPSPGGAPQEVARVDLPAADCRAPHTLLLLDDRTAVVVCEGDHVGKGSVVWLDLVDRKILHSEPVGVYPDDIELVAVPPR